MEERKTIEIDRRPACGGNHTYVIEVLLRWAMKMPRPNVCLSPQPVNLTERFTCPESSREFEHEFTIKLPVGTQVADVTVLD